MPLILNIETASPVCSVALTEGEAVLDFLEDRTGNSHAKILTVFIEELLRGNKISASELDAVAVSAGPGSYTGLRIGTSVAKGLCYALNKPLIAIPTLLSLAAAIQAKNSSSSAHYLPVLDARRMDAYTAVYDGELNEIHKVNCDTLNQEFEDSIADLGNIYVGGNAMEKCKGAFSSSNFIFCEDIVCDARFMSRFSNKKFSQGEFENTAYYEPFYLKEFPSKM